MLIVNIEETSDGNYAVETIRNSKSLSAVLSRFKEGKHYFFLENQEKRVREGVGSFLVSKSNAGKGFGCL